MTSAVPYSMPGYGKVKGEGNSIQRRNQRAGGADASREGAERGTMEERGEEREQQPEGCSGGAVLCVVLKGQLGRLRAAITENYTSQTHKAQTHEGDMNGGSELHYQAANLPVN